MKGMPSYAKGVAGLIAGMAIGYAARRGQLCSFGAIEDVLVSGDRRRLRAFALALAVVLAGTQLLVAWDLFDPGLTVYVPAAIPWLSLVLGGLLFGLGMALVGTCGFGTLVRLGGGDLRSLVVLLPIGAVAFATQRGVLAPVRLALVEWATLPLPMLDRGDLITALDFALPFPVRLPLGLAMAAGLLVWAFHDRRLMAARRLARAGLVLGLAVVAGWAGVVWLAARHGGSWRFRRRDGGWRHRRRGARGMAGWRVPLGGIRRPARDAPASVGRGADGVRRHLCRRLHYRTGPHGRIPAGDLGAPRHCQHGPGRAPGDRHLDRRPVRRRVAWPSVPGAPLNRSPPLRG